MFPCILEKNVHSVLVGWMSLRSSWFIILFESSLSLLIICLVVLVIIESGVVKSPIIIVELSMSHFSFISFYFMYFGTLLLGAYIFIVMSSQQTDPFIIIIYPSLPLVTIFVLKSTFSGLPWWRSGWESACQCRGHGFKPWSGKIPHATEQLSPWATITEPARLEPALRNKRGHDSERPAHHNEEWPPLATTRESPHTETKTQHSHK